MYISKHALASQVIIKAISFINEWNNYFGVKTETKDQETILQIESLTKPAYSALMARKEMNSYNAQQTDDKLLLVAFCIHKMSQVTSLFFQDEIIKIINILEKIIQENENKNKGGINLITNVSQKSNLLIKIS